MKDTKAMYSAIGLIAVLFWPLSALIVVLTDGINPFLYEFVDKLAIVVCFAIVFLFRWLVYRENPISDLKVVPLWFYIMGFFGIGIHGLTWVFAVQNAPPEQATLVIYQWPILVVVFSAISLGQKLRLSQIAGCCLGFIGLFVLMKGKGLSFDSFEFQSGHVYALICALSWSLFSAISARYPFIKQSYLGVIFFFTMLTNGLIWFFVYGAPVTSFENIMLAGGFGVLVAISYVCWDLGMKKGDTQFVALSGLFIPVLATLFLVLAGKAALTISLALAVVFIFSGIVLAKFGKI